jgi:hypothetical protein
MAKPNRKSSDLTSADATTPTDMTAQDPKPTREPTPLSSMMGKLLSQGRRKAVQDLHSKGIETYGWKDGQIVSTKPIQK